MGKKSPTAANHLREGWLLLSSDLGFEQSLSERVIQLDRGIPIFLLFLMQRLTLLAVGRVMSLRIAKYISRKRRVKSHSSQCQPHKWLPSDLCAVCFSRPPFSTKQNRRSHWKKAKDPHSLSFSSVGKGKLLQKFQQAGKKWIRRWAKGQGPKWRRRSVKARRAW